MSYTENHIQHQCKRIPGLTNLPKEIFLWVFKWIVGKKLCIVKCILQAWVMKRLYMNHSPVPYTGLKSGLLGIKVVIVRTFLCTCVCAKCICIVWSGALLNKVHSDVLDCPEVEGHIVMTALTTTQRFLAFIDLCVWLCVVCVARTKTETAVLSCLWPIYLFPFVSFSLWINQNYLDMGFNICYLDILLEHLSLSV